MNVIHKYALALINTWEESFGESHVYTVYGVKLKIHKLVKDYHNQVYITAHRKKKKYKRTWINMLTESIHYTDQKTVRECTLSNQIDTEYEEEQRIIHEHGEEQLKKSEEEEALIMTY